MRAIASTTTRASTDADADANTRQLCTRMHVRRHRT
jgi:hypothetical protein